MAQTVENWDKKSKTIIRLKAGFSNGKFNLTDNDASAIIALMSEALGYGYMEVANMLAEHYDETKSPLHQNLVEQLLEGG